MRPHFPRAETRKPPVFPPGVFLSYTVCYAWGRPSLQGRLGTTRYVGRFAGILEGSVACPGRTPQPRPGRPPPPLAPNLPAAQLGLAKVARVSGIARLSRCGHAKVSAGAGQGSGRGCKKSCRVPYPEAGGPVNSRICKNCIQTGPSPRPRCRAAVRSVEHISNIPRPCKNVNPKLARLPPCAWLDECRKNNSGQ